MKMHELKTDPNVFQAMWEGLKTFDIRLNDRDFSSGDRTIQKETVYSGDEMKDGKPLEYTGREIKCEVNYILHGPCYGLADDWVVMDVGIYEFNEDFV